MLVFKLKRVSKSGPRGTSLLDRLFYVHDDVNLTQWYMQFDLFFIFKCNMHIRGKHLCKTAFWLYVSMNNIDLYIDI